jgi:hypothetical protein
MMEENGRPQNANVARFESDILKYQNFQIINIGKISSIWNISLLHSLSSFVL